MKHQMISLAVALLVAMPAAAQSSTELDAIREQLQALSQRVDKLAQENTALRDENARLKSVPVPAPTPTVAKAADWPNRVAIKGDIRYRHDQIDDETLTADRTRHVVRARLAVEAQATENIKAGIGLATTENGNPRSSNQSLDGEFSRKAVDLDLAYFDWTVLSGVHAIGGKMKMPFFRPGQSVLFDSDINPEGIAFTCGKGMLFGTAYGYWIDENVPVVATTATDADTMMYGVQLGAKVPVGATSLSLAAMYYDLAAAKGRRPFYNGSSNGNTLNGSGTAAVLAYDFRVLELSAELNAKLGKLPLQIWADVAQNQAADLNNAYTLGVMFGKAADAKSWEAGLAYELIEKDAMFAQHIDGEFAGGTTDSAGWIVRAGYAPLKNWAIGATYFITRRNIDVGTESDFDRLMLDFNVKY